MGQSGGVRFVIFGFERVSSFRNFMFRRGRRRRWGEAQPEPASSQSATVRLAALSVMSKGRMARVTSWNGKLAAACQVRRSAKIEAEGDMTIAPAKHTFTVDEYHRMGEAGILGEDD